MLFDCPQITFLAVSVGLCASACPVQLFVLLLTLHLFVY